MPSLTHDLFECLIARGSRLSWVGKWLMKEVWTREKYDSFSRIDYLQQGERRVNELEEIIAASAFRLYDEMIGNSPPERDVYGFLAKEKPCAVVVFDGLSLREMPVILELASRSNLKIIEGDFSLAALPSETNDFIDQRLRTGKVAPSQLPNRQELKDRGIFCYYYDSPNQRHRLEAEDHSLLLWSAFPDNTYRDSGARFPQHFEQIQFQLETAWLNIVQQIPSTMKILITSDHGYVYFGPGLSFPRSRDYLRELGQYLGGERYRYFDENENPPDHPDLAIIQEKRIAILRGRVQHHPPGPSAGMLYKHGGLSLMEMLTPWIVLEAC